MLRTLSRSVSTATKHAKAVRTNLSLLPPRTLVANSPLRSLSSLPPSRPLSSQITNPLNVRQLNTTRNYSSKAVDTFPDPERPGLYYHLYHSPSPASETTPVFAISFLQNAPTSADAPSIIGWLPALEGEQPGLNDFRENPNFREVLHEAIQGGLRDEVDDIQINGAIQTQRGWMHIHDERNIPALGRIGDPDDIIASVRVEDGKILAETYQPMPSYRLCTSDGVLKLTEGLSERLLQVLKSEIVVSNHEKTA